MNKKLKLLIFTLIGLLSLLTACSTGPAPTEIQVTEVVPTEQPTPAAEEMNVQTVSIDEIQNINWQWAIPYRNLAGQPIGYPRSRKLYDCILGG